MTWYVARNAQGAIASVHRDHMVGYNDEQLDDADPQIVAFLTPSPGAVLAQLLAPSDLEMARVTEDLLVTLLPLVPALRAALPPIVLVRINARRQIRGQPPV